MNSKSIASFFLVLALWAPLTSPTRAQEEPEEAPAATEEQEEVQNESDWEFKVTPIGWVTNATLDLTGPNRSVSSTVKAKDVLGQIQFAIGGRFEAQKGKWGILVDGNYLRLKETKDFAVANQPNRTLFSVTPDVRLSVLEAAGTYRMVDKERFDLDALVGVRYSSLGIILNATPAAGPGILLPNAIKLEQDLSFVDPILGTRGTFALGDDVDGFFYGDIGGFGIGSDFTYRVEAGVDWEFHENWSALLGYRVQGINNTSSRGPNRFDVDLTLYGPMLGIGYGF